MCDDVIEPMRTRKLSRTTKQKQFQQVLMKKYNL